jgi:pimeloyl-ACP methyl ester carboxylesterase
MRRRWTVAILTGAAAFTAASWLAARSLARRLISSQGLSPVKTRREDLLAALEGAGAHVRDLRWQGAAADPVELAGVFASPNTASDRGVIVFLHGKGGNAAEWIPDALRALAQGYDLLLPELRAHRPSGGHVVTYGYLEREDLALGIAAAERSGLRSRRIGVHSCSAGSSIALAWAAQDDRIRALWLESPFSEAREMARHYLSLATGLPVSLLGLTTRFAVGRALAAIRRTANAPRGEGPSLDAFAAVSRVRARICLVYGDRDALVPPEFTRRLVQQLPPGSLVWNPRGAGHCHHDDEPEKVAAEEYVERWTDFFARGLASEEDVESGI